MCKGFWKSMVAASDRKEVTNDRPTMSSLISAIAPTTAEAVLTTKSAASINWLGTSGSGAVAVRFASNGFRASLIA